MIQNVLVIKDNGLGTLSLLNAQPIYRLSSSKNVIYLYAPYSLTNTVQVAFLLANNVLVPYRKITPSSVDITSVVPEGDIEEGYLLWEYSIPSAVLNAVAQRNASEVAISFKESEITEDVDYLGYYTTTSELTATINAELKVKFPLATTGQWANVWQSTSNTFFSWLFDGADFIKQTNILNQQEIGHTGQLTLTVNPSVNSDDEEIDITVTAIVFDELSQIWAQIDALTGVGGVMLKEDYDPNAYGDTVEKARTVDDGSRSKSAADIIDGKFETIDYNDGGVGGKNSWSDTEQAIETIINANVTLQNGRELLKLGRNTGASIPDLEPLAVIGSVGQTAQVEPVDITDPSQSFKTIGMATEVIGTNETKNMATIGRVRGDFTGFTEGADLYCAVGGGLSETKPSPPNRCIRMGTLEKTGASGIFYLNPIILPNFGELSDVDLSSAQAEDLVIKGLSGVYEPYALNNIKFTKTGWTENITDKITYDITNVGNEVTVTISASEDIDYYIDNVKYTLLASTPIVGTATLTEGAWFITLLPNGTLSFSQTAWSFFGSYVWCIELYWNATDSVAESHAYEFHSYEMSGVDHRQAHFADGTYITNGLVTSDNGDDTISVTGGSIGDEDILVTVVDNDTPTANFEQPLSPLKTKKWYRTGASGLLRSVNDDTTPFYVTGNKVQLNPYNGSSWGLVDMTNNKYGAYWVVVTTDKTYPVKLFLGQTESDTLNNAKEDNGFSTLQLGSIPIQEIKTVDRIIVQQINLAPYYHIEEITRFVDIRNQGQTTVVNSHGALQGLLDDDHPQYHNDARGDLRYEPIGTKVDKDLSNDTDYVPLTGAGALGTENVYVDAGGTPKKMTLDEVAVFANTATGAFVSSADYKGDGLGAYKSAMLTYHDLALVINSDFKVNIKTQVTKQIVYLKFPAHTNTSNLRVSTDDGAIYYDVLINGGNVAGNLISNKLVKLQFDGTNFIILDDIEFSSTQTYTDIIQSTFGTINPIELGSPLLQQLQGLTLNQVVPNGDFSNGTTGWSSTGLASFTVTSEVASFTANVTNGNISQSVDIVNGNKYYFSAKVKVTGGATDVFVRLSDGSVVAQTVYHSGSGNFERLSAILTAGANGGGSIQIRDTRASSWTQVDVDEVMVIPIDNTPYSLLTASQINARIDGYIEGITDLSNLPIKSVGKNLFDKTQYDTVTHSYLIRVKPSTNYVWSESVEYKLYDSEQTLISTATGTTVTTTSATVYISFANTIASVDTFQLEQGTVATTYSAYKTNTQTFNGTFRSVGSVRDIVRFDTDKYVVDRYVGKDTTVVKAQTYANSSVDDGFSTSYVFFVNGFTGLLDVIQPSTTAIVPNINSKIEDTNFIGRAHSDNLIDGNFGVSISATGQLYFNVSQSLIDAQSGATITDKFNNWVNANDVTFYYEYDTPLLANEEIDVDGDLIQDDPTTIIQGGNLATELDIKFSLNQKAQNETNLLNIQKNQREIKLNEDKIEALDTRVTANEQLSSANENAIIGLQTDVTALQGKVVEAFSGSVSVDTATSVPAANITLTASVADYDYALVVFRDSSVNYTSQRIDFNNGSRHNIEGLDLITDTSEAKIEFRLERITNTTLAAYYGQRITTTYGSPANMARAVRSTITVVKVYLGKY